MALRRFTVVAALVGPMLLGCGEAEEKTLDPFTRIDGLSAEVTALNERVEKLERQTPEGREAAAYEADKQRLKQLRAGQRQTQDAQKLLCDATGQC